MEDVALVFEQVGDEVRGVPFNLDSGTILITVTNEPLAVTVTSAEDYGVVRDVLELIVGWLPGEE